jgi:hypothetical protein
MRWLVTLVLLAGISVGSPTVRAEWGMVPFDPPAPLAPTTPQVPAPQVEAGRAPAMTPQAMPGQANGTSSCPDGGCAHKTCLQKLKAWLCFCPTAGDALPKLKVHPYIGPYVGTFGCTSAPCSTCGGGSGASCGGKMGCAAASASPPSGISMGKGPVPIGSGPAAAVSLTPMAAQGYVPMAVQGYPGRGCQGGSSQTLPMSPIPEESIPVVEVEFKRVGFVINSDATGLSAEFIPAVLTARQVITPIDALMRRNSQP